MFKTMAFLAILVFLTQCGSKKTISLETLLKEMTDREQITLFPETGYRTLQASSFNRESVSPDQPGWFADSDGIGFIRTEENNGQTEWVIMEDEGPGAITKIWAVCFYYGLNDTTGANIRIYLDGNPEPVINTNFFALVKGQDFVKPPFADETTRAGNLYLPIPYAQSCKITMDKQSFYNIVNYREYPQGTPVRTFTMDEFRKTAELRKNLGQTLENPPEPVGRETHKQITLNPGDSLVQKLPGGPHALKLLEVKILQAEDYAQALRSTVLTGHFDGQETIWCPIGDFFNNVGKIQPYEMWERSVKEDSTMICRWIMPWKETGIIGFKNLGDASVTLSSRFITGSNPWKNNSMHFYASWQMNKPTPTFPIYDWNFLSAEGKGVIAGDQWTVLNPAEGWWGEGDEKIWVDQDFDENFPSHFGTGTEDYYGWAGGVVPTPADQFSKPFLGNIIVGHPRSQGYNVCTRTRVLDAIPFREKIQFDFESSSGTRQQWFFLQYAQTTFWYGLPGVRHNRSPRPAMASKKLPAVEDLQLLIEETKKEQYFVDGALEAELLTIAGKSDDVVENYAPIPVWGEISNGDMANLWFENQGDFVEFKITEQFENQVIKVCAAVGRNGGKFNIYVNGRRQTSQDFYSNHGGVTNPWVDLGENTPVENAFVIKFEYAGFNSKVQLKDEKAALGIDFFQIQQP